MYKNQSYPEKYSLRKQQSNDDYELCNTAQRFVVQWSPRDSGLRYISRNRYASPGSLSKSVPRRNRSTIRYGINRSLNFDLGSRNGSNVFSSPNSSSDSNNLSTENDNYLSRSAKILRALNIDYSPLKSASLSARRINKSLNFDLDPSPERRGKSSQRKNSQPHRVSPLARINKTLNFETSSAESSVNSVLDSSVESIDENQNQTPSQRNNGRKAKKSLDYASPKFSNSPSPDPSLHSPMLRNDLREKIDYIVRQNSDSALSSSTRYSRNKRFEDFGASTPRNLFDELRDEEAEGRPEDPGRPMTPENFVRIIPESMSAIKKSHKKERVLGRMSKSGYQAVLVYQGDARSGSESLTDTGMELDDAIEEKRPTTPPPIIDGDRYESPQLCGLVNSIKQSHKRDKSKRRSYGVNSGDEDENEDEMSETGSLFDYASGSEKKNSAKRDLGAKVTVENPTETIEVPGDQERPAGSSETPISTEKLKIVTCNPILVVTDVDATKTPEKTCGISGRPGTPENRLHFLQRIMTDSIKKSHKKVKDTNKRSFFKPRLLNPEPETLARNDVAETASTSSTDDHRAGTPENTNSSRLLLSQFSSVKKSHRKDKHKRMVSGTLQRKKYFGRENVSSPEARDCSVSSEFPSPSGSNEAPGQSTELSDDGANPRYCSSDASPLDNREIGVNALGERKSSPNKRKNELCQSWTSPNIGSARNETSYESAEEEFKIFTPIKKRKSLNQIAVPIARRICPEGPIEIDRDEGTTAMANRCSTPRITRASGLSTETTPDNLVVPGTPEVGGTGTFLPIVDRSSPREEENPNETSAGRATPQNLSTAVLMAGINSIKKSHKKDKRGNAATRRPLNQDDEFAASGRENDTRDDSGMSIDVVAEQQGTQVKTPPNCLQAKNYLRLLRTESIKRSHKKVRDRKKRDRVIVHEPELSDDGSIFDEAERSFDPENAEPKETGKNLSRVRTMNHLENEARNSECSEAAAASPRQSDNLSDDGSIFDSEEKLGSPGENVDVFGASLTDDF